MQPVLAAMDAIAAHNEERSGAWSKTIHTARSRTSSDYWERRDKLVMAPVSQELEPPVNPGRFMIRPMLQLLNGACGQPSLIQLKPHQTPS